MKKPLLWIFVVTIIIGLAIVIAFVHRNSRRININDVTRYADFSDNQIEKIILRKSVTSPEWAVLSDEDLISKWKDYFQKLELKQGSRPAESDLSINGGGMRIVNVSINEKEFSFGVLQTSTECIIELEGKYYITNHSKCPFDETYDEAVARYGITTPWD